MKKLPKIATKIIEALRDQDAERVWTLISEIAGKQGTGIPDEAIDIETVPGNLSWEYPSLVQAFALTFEGDGWRPDGSLSADEIYRATQPGSPEEALRALTLTELRGALYQLQRACRWNDDEPDPRHLSRLIGEIQRKIELRDA